MKTKVLIFAIVALLLGIAIPSCLKNGDDTIILESDGIKKEEPTPNPDPNPNPNQNLDSTSINGGHYFEIDNSKFCDGQIPSGSCGDFSYVNMNSMVLAGGTNLISVYSTTKYDKFYIGIDGVNGYYEYVPEVVDVSYFDDAIEYCYNIPLKYSMDFQRNITISISASSVSGCVSSVYSQEIVFVQSKEGALNVVLTFDNAKDIDLHLVTPSGRMIFFGDSGGFYNASDGSLLYYGLDHDSNAGCSFDGLNNENIVISEEFVEPGDYKVYVNLFSNCNPSIATNWSCTVRYHGQLLENKVGSNPATGVYPVGAEAQFDFDSRTPDMVFSVLKSKAAKANASALDQYKFMPVQPSRATLQKIASRKK